MKLKITKKKSTKISKWVSLIEKDLQILNKIKKYHSIKVFDYISIISKNECGRIPIIKQYRPAMERNTLEFPCGLKDEKKNTIFKIAKKEFEEETGLKIITKPKLICKLKVDTGRVENNFFGFFVKSKFSKNKPEKGLKMSLVSKKKLIELIKNGKFNHSVHVSHFAIADMKNLI